MPWIALDPSLAEAAPATDIGAPLTSTGKTLASMSEELRLALGGRGDADDTRRRGWINDAYVDLCSSLQIEELKGSLALETVAAQPFYGLPPVVDTILGVGVVLPSPSLREGYPLEKVSLSTYREMLLREGEPTMYFRQGQMLVLWPTPDEEWALSLDFRVTPVLLEADTDSPFIPVLWHEGIVLMARQKAFSSLLEFDKAVIAGNDFTDFIRRKRDRQADEDEGRIVGSSVPRKLSDLRNRTHRVLIED